MLTNPYRRTWRKPHFIAHPALRYAFFVGVFVYFFWAVSTLPFNWERIQQGLTRAQIIFSIAFPPDFSRTELLIEGFVESIQIAILATVLGVLISIPVALLSARNIVPAPVRTVGRFVIVVARSFHPIIVAILFVKALGFGPLAGVLTLAVYSLGFVAKLLADAIEEIDQGQVEAIEATGAGRFKTLMYAVFPQILPRQVGLTLYQLDSNLRASAIVGIVGGGGIGATLNSAFGRYDYDFALAILLVVIALILISEGISGRLRRNFT